MQSSDWVAVVGIISTLLGTLLAFVVGWWIEKRRWQREDKFRFSQEHRHLYLEFSTAVELLHLHYQHPTSKNLESLIGSEAECLKKIYVHFNQVFLLATEPVRKSARGLTEACVAKDVTKMLKQLESFSKSLRAELGIKQDNK